MQLYLLRQFQSHGEPELVTFCRIADGDGLLRDTSKGRCESTRGSRADQEDVGSVAEPLALELPFRFLNSRARTLTLSP